MAPALVLSSSEISAWVGSVMWPFMRIAMLMAVAPIFGGNLVPGRIRLVLALATTAVVVPVIPAGPAVDPLSAEGVLIAVQQVLIGLAMGTILQLVFQAMIVGGQTVATSMGLGFASMVDPQNGIQVPVIGQYYVVVATLLFLALNGHLVALSVLVESFHSLPVAAEGMTRDDLWSVAAWAGRMFAGAVLIAIPAVTALLMVNLAFGVITRAAPQLNIFGVGFPVTMTIGFIILMVPLPALLPQLTHLTEYAVEAMQSLGGGR